MAVLFPWNGDVIRRGLDLRGGMAVTLEIAKESLADNGAERKNQLKKAEEIMRKRVDALGISEPLIRIRGDSQIEIQLAGVFAGGDSNLVDVIKKPAKLEFRLLHNEQAAGGNSPPLGYELIPCESQGEGAEEMGPKFATVRRISELGGGAIKRAGATVNSYGANEVSLEFTGEGAKKFEQITRRNVGKQLGIVLDGKLYSAPLISSVISDGKAVISGHFTRKGATDLANVLNNPLEFELRVAEMHELGPSLADEVQRHAVNAAIIGSLLVMLFMVLCSAVAGLVTVLSIVLNVLIILGILVTIGATMTLPAIAALVLTIGMGVDANIIIFARMREEMFRGKSMHDAIGQGFKMSFSSILDANLTSLLSAIILAFYGVGPIRGFGIILAIGVLSSLFCSIVFTRGFLELIVDVFHCDFLFFPYKRRKKIINFMGIKWPCAALASAAVAMGILAMAIGGKDVCGIDFRGGEEYVLSYDEKPPMETIFRAAEMAAIGEIIPSFQRSIKGDGCEELKLQVAAGKGIALLSQLNQLLPQCHFSVQRQTSIGASLSAELRKNAAISIAMSLLAMLIYLTVRFRIGFAVGAIVAILHDILVTAGVYVLLGHQWSAPLIAAILMVIGYSVNDTIVIFDRIREELTRHPERKLHGTINDAISKTLSRTLLTSLSTFLAAISLWIFGAGVIRDFSAIFSIGILVGTFSSIFIASPIFYWFHRKEHVDVDKKSLHFEENGDHISP
jgi:SecD/SecF fusion protein